MNTLSIAEAIYDKLFGDDTSMLEIRELAGLSSDHDATDVLVMAISIVNEIYSLDGGVTLRLISKLREMEDRADGLLNNYRI